MFRVRSLATTALTASVARRFVKSTDPTYEDDRWLEAQFQDVEKTVEERYAFEKQKEVMKKLMEKMRAEHTLALDTQADKLKDQHKEIQHKHQQEIHSVTNVLEELRARVNELEAKHGKK